MAQKTPLPALTVMYADRWNSTWFVDLENFRTQLMHDYHLRFLLTGFLRLKKQWLHLLSIHKSGGFYFFQVVTLNYTSSGNLKSFLEPDLKNQKKLKKIEYLVRKSPLFNNSALRSLKTFPESKQWRKRLPWRKQRIWDTFNTRVVTFQEGRFHFLGKALAKYKNAIKWKKWLKMNKNKVALDYYNIYLRKFLVKKKNTLIFLAHNLKNNKQKKLTKNLRYTNITKNTKSITMLKRNYPTIKVKSVQQLKFSSLSMYKTKKLKNRKFKKYNLVKDFSKQNKLTHVFYYRLQNKEALIKSNISTYKMLYKMASYFYKRMFRYKKYPTIKKGYKELCKKYGKHLKFTHMYRRLGNSILFIHKALNRVTAMQNYMLYLPLQWARENYMPLKKFVVFEKYSSQKSFVGSLALLHLAISRGSANLIIDLLVRQLRQLYKHVSFLSAVECISRYFLAPYEGNIAYLHSYCKGVEITFDGKLNGSERSNKWKFKFGPVHTSTFFTNTREQVAKCITRYGAFSINVRIKLGKSVTM
jgi:hypothetical protein